MTKTPKLIDTSISAEIENLFGDPPVLSTAEAKRHREICLQYAGVFKPREFMEWVYVRDLTDHRVEIQRLRGLKTRLISERRNEKLRMYANSIMFSSTSQIKDIEAAGAVELADKIKQLKGEPGQVKAETERLTSESKKMIAALVEKIKVESEGKFAEYQQTLEVDENDAESFGAWIGNYERADRALIAAEKKFKETLRELDDYRQGLGELLRRADDLIIDGEFQEDVTGAAEIESQVPAAVPPVVLPAVIAKEPVVKIQPMMPQRNQTSVMIFNQVSMPRQPNDVATRASSDAEIETAASVDEVTETNTSEDALTGFAPPAAPREETTLLAEDQRQTDEPSEDSAIEDVPSHDVGRAEAAVVAAAPGASDRAARA